MSSESTIKLRNGHSMPRLMLGTWKAPAEKTELAVKTALEVNVEIFTNFVIYKI